MNTNIKPAAIARMAALLVAVTNQALVLFGQDLLPFTENMAYQVISLLAVVIIAGINAWYNNDISKIARLCGGIFDALSDGKITEEEIEEILSKAEQDKNEPESDSGFIVVANKILLFLKSKFQKE